MAAKRTSSGWRWASRVRSTRSALSFSDGVHHFALLSLGPGGVPHAINAHEIQTRVFVASALVGLTPNAPTMLQATRLPGNKPCLKWVYSRYGEQSAPVEFRVFQCDDETEFNFGAPVAVLQFKAAQTRYSWTGAALAVGDLRYYTVRAYTAGGVASLAPRVGQTPSPDYTTVDKANCPFVEAPDAPPSDPGTPFAEVFDVV